MTLSKQFENTIEYCLYLSDFLCDDLYSTEIQYICVKYYTLCAEEEDFKRLYLIEKELIKNLK